MPRTIGFNDAWNEDDTRTMASVYVQDDIKLLDDRLTITPGVKFIYAYTTDHDDIGFFYPFGGSPHDQQSFTSPTIGINYKFTSDFAAYAAFGENLKLPDITALYDNITADFVPGVTTAANSTPTTHTNPEYVQDYEVGVRYQHAGFSGSLDGYLENFTNTFIDQVNDTTGATAVVNGGSSRYEGVEAQVMEDFGDQPWGHLKAKIDGSYNKAVYTSTFDSDADGLGQNEADVLVHSGTPVANVPQYLAYASADYTYHDWRVHANVQYRGSEFVNQSEAGVTGAVTIPSYVTFDAGITKVIPLAGFNSFAKSVKLSLNGYNLFNTYYYSEGELGSQENPITGKKTTNALYASPGAPRSFVFTAEAAF
jgi:outer membrane receptor protein involved in Fe transport